MKIQITETKTIEATPRMLAQAFWEMDNNQQADFFDHLGNIAAHLFSEQMQTVALFTDNLSREALETMAEIGTEAAKRIAERK